MWTAGIDPGLEGAVAFLNNEPGAATWTMPFVAVIDTPVAIVGNKRQYLIQDMVEILRVRRQEYGLGRVVLERVSAMPKQGVVSMFNFGRGLGLWEGICAGLGLPVWRVAPQSWKAYFGLRGGEKEQARVEAQRRWPTAALSRKKDHGRADALFLALYGIEKWAVAAKESAA